MKQKELVIIALVVLVVLLVAGLYSQGVMFGPFSFVERAGDRSLQTSGNYLTCVDSDGKDVSVKGFVSGEKSDGATYPPRTTSYEYWDSCLPSGMVSEWTCVFDVRTDSSSPLSRTMSCSEGESCVDGKCVSQGQQECQTNADCSKCYICDDGMCVENPALDICADFSVSRLVGVNPISGEETWEEVDLNTFTSLYGEILKYDSSSSIGDDLPEPYLIVYSWVYPGGINYFPVMLTSIENEGVNNVEFKLTQYLQEPPWTLLEDTETKNVNVGQKMTILSKTQNSQPGYPEDNYRPNKPYKTGNKLYFISGFSHLYGADISDPDNLGALNLLKQSVSGFGLAANSQYLFLNRQYYGAYVDVYEREPFNPQPVMQITSAELDGYEPYRVEAWGDYAFVFGVDSSQNSKLFVFLTTSTPQRISSLDLSGVYYKLKAIEPYIAVVSQNGLRVLDLSDPYNPEYLPQTAGLPAASNYYLTLSDTHVAVLTTGGTYVYEIADFYGASTPTPKTVVTVPASDLVIDGSILYLVQANPHTITKVNIVGPGNNPYVMDVFDHPYYGMQKPYIHDPDGAGPEESVLLIGHNGYSAISK